MRAPTTKPITAATRATAPAATGLATPRRRATTTRPLRDALSFIVGSRRDGGWARTR